MNLLHPALALLLFAGLTTPLAISARAAVEVLRVPEGGIQPRAVTDEDGTLHLVYYVGSPKAGNLRYVSRAAGETSFSPALTVNSRPGSAVAMGTIRGAQVALGRDRRLHVVWNGSQKVTPGDHARAPLLYTRWLEERNEFEPERNIITWAWGLDGGSSVAADSEGHVRVIWHARGEQPGEEHRRVYLALSGDEGATFAREIPVNPPETGVCGCCGLKAFTDAQQTTYILYRAAREKSLRDAILLAETKPGSGFSLLHRSPWRSFTCPMSSGDLADGQQRTWACWETEGKVWFGAFGPSGRPLAAPRSPKAVARQKHPSLASNPKGEVLLAWAEGTGWNQGGSVAWQVYDKDGHPTGISGRLDDLPVWSFPAVTAGKENHFILIY